MVWDSDSVYMEDIASAIQLPTRSRLYSLAPRGIGTADNEGLISYIVRLADAHSISPRLLIRSEFMSLIQEPKAVGHAEFFSDFARTLHGTGVFARKFVDITEQLTLRQDLMFLTTLPWQEIVPSIGTGFMTPHPKWCKRCLAEHMVFGETAHFRLSWAYVLYEVCLRHTEPLTNTCPWCNKYQPFLPYIPDLSRCAHCLGWLGTINDSNTEIQVNEQQLWVAGAIENMLINASDAINFATGDAFRCRLAELVNSMADGQKTKLSRMLGMTATTMTSWITKKQKPLLPQFLFFCKQVGVMPSELFWHAESDRRSPDTTKPHLRLHDIKPRMKIQLDEKNAIRQRLMTILEDENDYRPLTEIAVELGITRKYLLYWFSNLCIQISIRHREYVKKMAQQKRNAQIISVRNTTRYLHNKGLYPSNRKVALMIAPSKLSLRRKHLRQTHQETMFALKLANL